MAATNKFPLQKKQSQSMTRKLMWWRLNEGVGVGGGGGGVMVTTTIAQQYWHLQGDFQIRQMPSR